MTSDVPPVTGPLVSGGSTNDTDLTVRVSLSGTGAVVGDTIQLYNGTDTGSPLGTSHTLSSSDISNGFADVQTGTLSNGTTYTITARLTGQTFFPSLISGPFQHGLVLVLSFSIAASLVAAAASALRGGHFVHQEAETVPLREAVES